MIDYQAIGGRIRTCRKKRRLTQTGLGRAVGLSAAFIGHVERGTRKASLETIILVAEALDASLDILLTGAICVNGSDLPLAQKKQMLNDVMRVLEEHFDEWMPAFRS